MIRTWKGKKGGIKWKEEDRCAGQRVPFLDTSVVLNILGGGCQTNFIRTGHDSLISWECTVDAEFDKGLHYLIVIKLQFTHFFAFIYPMHTWVVTDSQYNRKHFCMVKDCAFTWGLFIPGLRCVLVNWFTRGKFMFTPGILIGLFCPLSTASVLSW